MKPDKRGGTVLAMMDLKDITDYRKRAFKRWQYLLVGIITSLMIGVLAVREHQLRGLEAEVARLATRVNTEAHRANVEAGNVKALTQTMKLSVDVGRLKKPVRFSGEMLLIFGGDFK